MCNPKVNPVMIFDYEERIKSFLADGYHKRHETTFIDGSICRLHHMCNGNDIVIIARGNHLIQKTNHVVTHEQYY